MNTDRILNDAELPSPLPQRVVPYPDEDLLSLLRRSASRMGYPDLRWLLRPERNTWNIKDTEIPLLSAKKDYEVLEHLLMLSEEELYSHTLHRFASLLVTNHTTRVCPYCVQDQHGYDRLYWSLHGVQACPYHHVRLLD
jgi:TniQ